MKSLEMLLSLVVSLVFSTTSFAEEAPVEINVHLLEQSSAVNEPSITVIGSKELDEHQGQSAAELLQQIVGLQVQDSGGAGQPSSLLIRGASSQETLVLIDGQQVNDPLNPSQGFDFSQMSLESLERVEIYRGPQTVRFGNGATGGVINFVTRQGQTAQASALLEAGAYQTVQSLAQFSGRKDQLSYSLGAHVFSTAGFSAADAQAGATENDGQRLSSFSSRVGWAFDANHSIEAILRSTQTQMDLDRSGGSQGDDPNYAGQSNQLLSNVQYHQLSLDGKLDSLLMLSTADFQRKDRNDPDSTSANFSWDTFLSHARQVELNNEYFFSENRSLRLGLQFQDESGQSQSFTSGTETDFSKKYESIFGSSLIYSEKARPFFYELGIREDQALDFGSVSTFSVAPGYLIEQSGTTLRASLSSGFKAPSLYQLYSNYGDKDLSAEKVQSWEVSAEQKISQQTVMLTYFENRYRNLIDFNTTSSKYQNIGQAWTHGLELQWRIPIEKDLFLTVNDSYLLTRDQTTGLALLRRPQNTIQAELAYDHEAMALALRCRYVGERADLDPVSFNRVTMSSYEVVDLSASYRLTSHLQTRARLDNILNRKYEAVNGYGTSGAALYVGLLGEMN